MTKQQHIEFKDNDEALALMGKFDHNLTLIEDNFPITIIPQGNQLILDGSPLTAEKVKAFFEELIKLYRRGHRITSQEFEYALSLSREGQLSSLWEMFDDLVYVTTKGKKVKPKTIGQKEYVQAIRSNDIVIGIGPAGTGKTYLAMAMAIAALKEKQVQRILLTRPAVEAGEHLGFLPGDLQEKVDPYLRPLYDALYEFLGVETFQKYMEKGLIEVAPLAYMRGRTLDDSFIILDEAQNTTPEQMKMFLTRLGFGSRAIITGDITQVDLPRGKSSGLDQVKDILKGIKGIYICYLTDKDVVRHPLVQKIIRAYNIYQMKEN